MPTRTTLRRLSSLKKFTAASPWRAVARRTRRAPARRSCRTCAGVRAPPSWASRLAAMRARIGWNRGSDSNSQAGSIGLPKYQNPASPVSTRRVKAATASSVRCSSSATTPSRYQCEASCRGLDFAAMAASAGISSGARSICPSRCSSAARKMPSNSPKVVPMALVGSACHLVNSNSATFACSPSA